MTRTVEFYFDFVSTTSYLAYTQLPALAERINAQIVWKPALLGGIFKETGNSAPITVPAKGAWMYKDLMRFAKRYNVPFVLNPHFPFNSLHLMRGALVAQRDGYLERYINAVFPAIWVDGLNMTDPAVAGPVLAKAGIDAEALFEAIQAPEIKHALIQETAQAVERGVFGMPAFFVDDELFFGQDRLDFVEEALLAQPIDDGISDRGDDEGSPLNIVVRQANHEDAGWMQESFDKHAWGKPEGYFANCCRLQDEGRLVLLVATVDGNYAGHCKIIWEPTYPYFKENKIPETQDLNVLAQYRRNGIATKLVEETERLIGERSEWAGIGFGLYRDYGAAQRMYVLRGYVPDGQGIVYEDVPVTPGESYCVDDGLVLGLVKRL